MRNGLVQWKSSTPPASEETIGAAISIGQSQSEVVVMEDESTDEPQEADGPSQRVLQSNTDPVVLD